MNQAYQAIRRQNQGQGDNQRAVALSFPALLERSKAEIAKALPRHLNPDRMTRIALTAFRTNPKLGECDPMSVLAAVVQASQMGLEIGMMGEAYLVPFKKECQLIPGYAGLMKLARQSGQVADIYAHEVRENDAFHLRLGMGRELVHEPMPGKGGFPASAESRGDITGFYAVCMFKDQTSTFVALSVEDVNRIRDRSNGYKMAKNYGRPSPWDTDYVEMGKKTAIRALAKIMPKSPELATALAMDGAADAGASQSINLEQAADGTYAPQHVEEQVDQETGEVVTEVTAQMAEPEVAAPAPEPAAKHATAKQQPERKETAKALERYLDAMDAATTDDQLNEAYIRAETSISGEADRQILDREYETVKRRIDGSEQTLL